MHRDVEEGVVQLSAYSFDRLRDDGEFVLHRGRAKESGLPGLLLLTPASARPVTETLRKIQNEYSLRNDLDSAWAVRPIALSEHGAQVSLILEDPGGDTLDTLLSGPMAMSQFLAAAVALAAALGGLHARKLIHKDLKPSNVLIDTTTGQARLTGFGIASRLRRERQDPEPPEIIDGTLPYMAPEQTGRMNRSIDSRSDLYALGVTLYEMLTGSLPFIASDPIEWVHCHIAKHPVPPHDRVTSAPAVVSAIVMKLLAKTPEERYQTASGVESDLRRCLGEWEAHGGIADFPLGERDAPDRLLLPEKLYGRDREVETLLAAFDRVVAGGRPELVLVSGYSGIGKSRVVNELHKPLVPPRGLFASGKFDQYKRDIPYATLAQAFQSLIRPLLSRSESELIEWRDALRDALEPNGQLMIGLVPELKAIIGEQPPVADLPAREAQARFHLVFRRFISVFARPEHPLALFLDDLQWLDAATLDLLEDLLTQPDVSRLLLIGAYRDNEVGPTHPLARKLEAMRSAGALLHDIVLTPLTRQDLEQLLADALHCTPAHARPLAELVHDKTAGNPFFAIQFMSSLFDEGLITFDHHSGLWSWDLTRIHAKGYSDNVVDLMVRMLSRLAPETRSALKQLACLGNRAELGILDVVYQDSIDQVHMQLADAVEAGFIFRSKDSYNFLHDRVQEAAYSLIPHDELVETHLRIGMLMASHTPEDRLEESIFEIVNQLNRGLELLGSVAERERVAGLNLIAGRRAKASTAYASALKYLRTARELLSEETWTSNYDLIFQIECLLAECELLSTEMRPAEDRLTMLAGRARTNHDVALVVRLRLTLYTAADRSDRACEVCLEYLRGRGTTWSMHPTAEDASREYAQVWTLLGDRPIEDLIDLPLASDQDALDDLDVLCEVVSSALFIDVKLVALVICRMVSLSLQYGNCDASCYAYVWLGMLAGPQFGDYPSAFRFGKLGYDLVEQRGLRRYQARTHISFVAFIIPWTKHLKEARPLHQPCFDAAFRIGDLTYSAYTCNVLHTHLLATGDPLPEVQLEAEKNLAFATTIQFGLEIDLIAAQLGLIRTLRGLTRTFGAFDDEHFDERGFERHLADDPVLALAECWYWIRKLQARFIAGDYPAALEASSKAERLLWTSPSFFETAEYHFYSALLRAACCGSPDPSRDSHFEPLSAHQKQHAIWAQHCPENFENRAALVDAEVARIEGRVLEAEQLYERAIRSAHDNGFVNNEALANELAARFYAARGFQTVADAYLLEARYCYHRWGANGKVAQLDHLYPHLKTKWAGSTRTSSIFAPAELVDLATVIKVSQAVSGEMVRDKLVNRVMRAALEQAGADRGLLIVPGHDEPWVEAEASTTGGDITVRLGQGSGLTVPLPESLVRFVARTSENVILDDASSDKSFSGDPYIVRYRPRSIVTLPLINRGKLIRVLHLENALVPHVFTPDRITALKVLASQAATSLESTQLYRDLEERERRIRQDERELRLLVDAVPQSIVAVNADGTFRSINRAGLDYLGRTLEDITQANDPRMEMYHPDDFAAVSARLGQAFADGSSCEFEARLRRHDGTYRWFLVRYEPLRDEEGRTLRWYGTGIDIDERKRAEDRTHVENLALREEVDKASTFKEIVGESAALQRVLAQVGKVAPTDSTVLITGETGTGKELIARAIHNGSHRSSRVFVSVNCAAIPRELIASELFGHEKGAFTGAVQPRVGRFELAERGTIFLDEVGELPAETQVALLRVLQERQFERLGGSRPIRADVRIIAATNRDLESAISSGGFRADLFYRLNVFPIEMPSLRERREDIPALVRYFVDRFSRAAGKKIKTISTKTLDLLQAYEWPGNVRELQNLIERSVIISDGDTLLVDERWLHNRPARGRHTADTLPEQLTTQERAMIEAALAETRGKVSGPAGAAAKLRMPASTLESRIRALGIDKRRFRPMY